MTMKASLPGEGCLRVRCIQPSMQPGEYVSPEIVYTIWAYCLMKNHVHLLAVPAAAEFLTRCIGSTNLLYTQYVNRKYGHSGRLWQNRFFSTIIDTDRYVWAVARYIEQNPVKAKLVQKPKDYL